jgi:uncharacterized protein
MMRSGSSRRNFLAAGVALPAAAAASSGYPQSSPQAPPRTKSIREVQPSFRVLGKTGLKVTTVGFGCMITSDSSVIARAIDMGVNYFDTSRDYQNGNNERMVGSALGAKRKDAILATKTDGLNTKDALAELDTSLKELKTAYVDVWYLHDKSRAADLSEGLIQALQTAKKSGKTRFTGVSVHSGHRDVIPAVIKSGQFDVLLTSYNFAMGTSIDDLIDAAVKAGMGVVAMKVMAGSFRLRDISDRARAAVKRPGAHLAALKWAIRNPNIATTIPSMTDMEQLEENVSAMAVPFGASDSKVLSAQLDYIRPLYCRMCGSCQGACPQGLPVSDMLRYLSYAEGYGQFSLARERFLELPETLRSVRCSGCETCSVTCPNGVKIAERLGRAQTMLA